MNDFKKQLKRFRKFRNIAIVSIAVLIFLYIGAEPYLNKSFGNIGVFQSVMFILVLSALIIEFYYESKYSKAAKYISDIDLQISDAGYYITSREENGIDEFYNSLKADIENSGYKLTENSDADGLTFDFYAGKGTEYIYAVKLDNTERSDVIAYLDAAKNDLLSNKLKRKGECVVLFITDKAEDSAIALSKAFSRVIVSRYNVITISPAIIEPESKKVYYLGNRISPTQKIVTELVLKSEFPLDNKFIHFEKLSFQKELEKEVEDFNIQDFKSRKYNER